MGLWDKNALRRKLMPPDEQEAFLRTYGEAARPMLEAVLDAKVEELAVRHEKSWRSFGEYLQGDQSDLLVTRKKAAKMLGVSLSSIQRLEKRGDLPPPHRSGRRTVRHRLQDILAFAKSNGLSVRPPS
jgi:predicted DNA-binding transcriptional regulator AlpA